VRLDAHAIDHPPIEFAGIFPRANLGGQFLRHFVVTFDQRNHRVRFTRPSDEPLHPAARRRIGVAFAPSPEGLKVMMVVAGGAGENAGLREGDLVVAIDGEPAGAIGQGELRERLGGAEPLTMHVRRGDEEHDVT